jgi:tRNA (guanine-N7-)-methyltransferase
MYAIKKIDEDIDNLRFIRMDARLIDEVFDKEIDLIYLNFSDPWPKKRQAKRRLTHARFL